MEPKTKKISAREAASFVESNFKAGDTMRHIGNGQLYMLGMKHGMSDFWMMSLADSKKGLVPAIRIKQTFQKVA